MAARHSRQYQVLITYRSLQLGKRVAFLCRPAVVVLTIGFYGGNAYLGATMDIPIPAYNEAPSGVVTLLEIR
jgi:hypothetical protein